MRCSYSSLVPVLIESIGSENASVRVRMMVVIVVMMMVVVMTMMIIIFVFLPNCKLREMVLALLCACAFAQIFDA